MTLLAKVKDGFLEHIGTTIATVVTMLLGWIFYQVAPALLPAVEAVPPRTVIAILLLSILLNVALAFAAWHLSRPRSLKLRFGILWDKDKNPHCPVCKNPGITYGNWGYNSQTGYYCNPCKEVFSLADASGSEVRPGDVVESL